MSHENQLESGVNVKMLWHFHFHIAKEVIHCPSLFLKLL